MSKHEKKLGEIINKYSGEFDALSCLNTLYVTLQMQIDKFNSMTFYQ